MNLRPYEMSFVGVSQGLFVCGKRSRAGMSGYGEEDAEISGRRKENECSRKIRKILFYAPGGHL